MTVRAPNQSSDQPGKVARIEVALAHLNQFDTSSDCLIDLLLERRDLGVDGARVWRESLAVRDETDDRQRGGVHGGPSAGVIDVGAPDARRASSAEKRSRMPASAVMTPTPVTAPRMYVLAM